MQKMLSWPDILNPSFYRIHSESSPVIIQACIVAFAVGIWLSLISYRSAIKKKSSAFFWCGNFSLAFAFWNICFLSSYAERDIEVWQTSLSNDFAHRAYLALGVLLPCFAHACLRRIYRARYLISGRLHFIAFFMAALCFLLPDVAQWQAFTWACGLVSFSLFGWINFRIWKRYLRARNLRLKTRSLFLGLGLSIALFFMLIGQIRAEGLIHFPLPYIGNLVSLVFVYFVYQMIQNRRLREVRELMLRGIRVVLLTLILGGIFLSLLFWVEENDPELFLFNTFLASFLIVSLLSPLKKQIDRFVLKRFIVDRFELEKVIHETLKRIRKARSLKSLSTALLMGMRDSDRVYKTGLYLWSPSENQFRLTSKSNLNAPSVIASDHPVIEYFRETKAPSLQEQTESPNALDLLRSLRSHIIFPIFHKNELLGVWCIRSSLSSSNPYTSFSSSEIEMLQQLTFELATSLEELKHFEKQDRQQRLAALGEMSAALAHEIRNPLGAIMGATQLLDTSSHITSSEDRECIQILKNEIERLEQTVNQYLHFARKSEQIVPVSLNTLIQKALNSVRAKAKKTKTELFFEPVNPAPELVTDPLKLEQVLINLIINACEAFSTKVWVELDQVQEGDQAYVEIRVRDNGPGIPAHLLQSIFTPLFTTKKAGSGLGLPICKKIIDSLGGELRAKSKANEGGLFIIRFKLAPKALAPLN